MKIMDRICKQMESDSECMVCFDDVPPSKMVACFACDSITCVGCTQQYLGQSPSDAHCMKCKRVWGIKFLLDHFPKSWVTGTGKESYRTHRKKMLLDREKARIPETMAYVAVHKETLEQQKVLDEMMAHKAELKRELRLLQGSINDVRWSLNQHPIGIDAFSGVKKSVFICPCPDEECRGLIESASSKCGVCDIKMCRRCREIRKEKHKCDKEKVETVKLLKADTKGCPKCATNIFKISGCDQMWCTQCQTAFSWKTGKIETGVIHNPHAVRWRREHGQMDRDANDIPCGGLPSLDYRCLKKLSTKQFDTLRRIHRATADVQEQMNRHRINNDFGDMRRDYVMKEIDEKTWRQRIFLRERSNARHQASIDILTTFRTLSVERIRNLIRKLDKRKHVNAIFERFVDEMMEIREFINKTFLDELPPLGTKKPVILNGRWHWASEGGESPSTRRIRRV